jgi:hypothetical protein
MEEEVECPEAEGGTANFTIDGPTSSIDVALDYLSSSDYQNEIGSFDILNKTFNLNDVSAGSSGYNTCTHTATGHSAIEFDDTSDSIIFTNLNTGNGSDLTISFWVYPATISGNGKYLFTSKTQGGNFNWSLLRDGSTWKLTNNQTNTKVDTSVDIDVNTWQHIAIVFDVTGAQVLFYKNGIEEFGTGIATGGVPGAWTVGGYSDNGTTGSGGFQCRLVSVLFHEDVLASAEILELATSAYDVDATVDFSNYVSSADLTLGIAGGMGQFCVSEVYSDGTSRDAGSIAQYSLEINIDTGGVSPDYPELGLTYINSFPS